MYIKFNLQQNTIYNIIKQSTFLHPGSLASTTTPICDYLYKNIDKAYQPTHTVWWAVISILDPA